MIRTLVRGTGQVFITAGLIILLFAVYELYGTGLATARAQSDLYAQIHRQWQSAPAAPATPAPSQTAAPSPATQPTATQPPAAEPVPAGGRGLAILHIPSFGASWEPRVIVQGVTAADLRIGPGHYPGTAMPGQVGNFAVAGHRATHGNGFMPLNTLQKGDPLVVETRDTWYTYAVTGSEIVLPTEVDVVDPVPHQPGAKPTQRLITLTTCNPWYSASHRLIVYGTLQSTLPKSQGKPAALKS